MTLLDELGGRRPQGLGWTAVGWTEHANGYLWYHRATSTSVVSSLDDAELPRSGENGPQWHISITRRVEKSAERPLSEQIALARCAFDMLTAEEDNHHPGNARHFWLPVDPSERVDCDCKATEDVIVDPDGYTWTNPTAESGEACRGCEFERMQRAIGESAPCPIHTQPKAEVSR